ERQKGLWAHLIWQTLYGDALTASQLHLWASKFLPRPTSLESPDFLDASLALDWEEIARQGLSPVESGEDPLDGALFDPVAWWVAHPDRPQEALTLWLRIVALRPPDGAVLPSIPDDLVKRLGVRAAAETALVVAELLALRLRTLALLLFAQAG